METNANQKVTCIVNYPYDASEPDELSLRVGDVVRGVERRAGGWWQGELRGRRGLFPDNFVHVHDQHRSQVGGRCRAVFSYQPANPDELPLCVGDVLEVLGEVEEGWWQGRRSGRVGVFPSNFVVMVDSPPAPTPTPTPTPAAPDPAPALPPKPVKEQCRVLFPYTAVNDDELTLAEGDIVTIVCKEAPDRGWWRGELRGHTGLFPDNFVQLLPTLAQDVEEKKPERPTKGSAGGVGGGGTGLYPLLNKYSEKTSSVKELTTSKISLHKENSTTKESSTVTSVTHSARSEAERSVHNAAGGDANSTQDGQVKKPPVPQKKSPTPSGGAGGVTGLLSGLKSKMMPNADKEKEKDRDKEKDKDRERDKSSSTVSSSSSGEWDRTDGLAGSKQAGNSHTFDHVERNSILNDPRAGRVKAPRRRPPSQAMRDDTPPPAAPPPSAPAPLSNGHDAPLEPALPVPGTDRLEEIKPRAREWEKHKAPWMEELKLNQAKKTSFGADGKARSVSGGEVDAPPAPTPAPGSKAGGGSTDRILECGVEEKRATHCMEMSRSTSAIVGARRSLGDATDEKSARHSLESKKDVSPPAPPPPTTPAPTTGIGINNHPPTLNAHSPTAAGRTFTTMLEEVRAPSSPSPAPAPAPAPSLRLEGAGERSPRKAARTLTTEKTETLNEVTKLSAGVFDKTTTVDRVESSRTSDDRPLSGVGVGERISTLERRRHGAHDTDSELVTHLNHRISNLEKLLEVQNAKFTAAIEELTSKLSAETERRQALQAQVERLAHCLTHV